MLGGSSQNQVQDHETPLFLSYFKDGISYLEGGHESGFRSIAELVEKPRLLHCKGKRVVRAKQVITGSFTTCLNSCSLRRYH